MLTTKQKRKWSLIGGVSALILGFVMIFFWRDKLGFLPAMMGAILLIWGSRRNHG